MDEVEAVRVAVVTEVAELGAVEVEAFRVVDFFELRRRRRKSSSSSSDD